MQLLLYVTVYTRQCQYCINVVHLQAWTKIANVNFAKDFACDLISMYLDSYRHIILTLL